MCTRFDQATEALGGLIDNDREAVCDSLFENDDLNDNDNYYDDDFDWEMFNYFAALYGDFEWDRHIKETYLAANAKFFDMDKGEYVDMRNEDLDDFDIVDVVDPRGFVPLTPHTFHEFFHLKCKFW